MLAPKRLSRKFARKLPGDPFSGPLCSHKSFYEKVIRVKADVAALRNLFSDVSMDVRW
jgi:hypothetical protein